MVTRVRSAFGSIAVIVLTLSACGDDPMSPITRADITGDYAASTFTVRSGGTTIDLLALGATLNITLRDDGTTTGRLFVPGGDEDGSDLDANLDGTFLFDDRTDEVTFRQDADTFVRDVTFTASRTGRAVQLEAEETFSDVTLRVVLR
jgi:hypothetical protein